VLGFGFIACRELMPELWDLSDAVAPALAELVEAAEQVSGESGEQAKRPAAAPAGG
jgi:hypothetical protein